MKRRLALTVTGTTVALGVVAGCGGAASAPPATRATSGPTPLIRSAPQVGCAQQYDAWAKGPGKGVLAKLAAVGSTAATGTSAAAKDLLKTAKPEVARAGHYPVPGCADPKGYWTALLMHLNAAAAAARPAEFDASMKGVPTITGELATELRRTVGKGMNS